MWEKLDTQTKKLETWSSVRKACDWKELRERHCSNKKTELWPLLVLDAIAQGQRILGSMEIYMYFQIIMNTSKGFAVCRIIMDSDSCNQSKRRCFVDYRTTPTRKSKDFVVQKRVGSNPYCSSEVTDGSWLASNKSKLENFVELAMLMLEARFFILFFPLFFFQ